MNITKSEYRQLRQEWDYLNRLCNEAQRLELDMDVREGLAIWENNPKHFEQAKRLKKVCRRRYERRFSLLMEVYEEMGQEELDCAVLCGTPVAWPREDRA